MGNLKRAAALLAATVAGLAGGAYMPRETEVQTRIETVERLLERNVIIQAGRATYELSYPDSIQMRDMFQPWATADIGELRSVSCTIREGMFCKMDGVDGHETIQVTGAARAQTEEFAKNMFRGKLEDIARFDCTMRVEHDVCMATGSKEIQLTSLRPGDTVLRLGATSPSGDEEAVATTGDTE